MKNLNKSIKGITAKPIASHMSRRKKRELTHHLEKNLAVYEASLSSKLSLTKGNQTGLKLREL